MNFQLERQLAEAFFMGIASQQLAHVPNDLWSFTNTQDHTWQFGVQKEYMDQYPYRFSLHFDQRNRVLTFSLLHQHTKSLRVFPHLYYRLIDHLNESGIDCVVRNGDDCLRDVLYKNGHLPFHGTGEMAKQIEGLLRCLLTYVDQGKFYFWKDGQTVHLATPHISPLFWSIQFVYDESKKDAKGMVEVAGFSVSDNQGMHAAFDEVKEKIRTIPYVEQAIIACVNRMDANSYYDPLSRSLVVFQKQVPFKVVLVATEKNQPSEFRYAVKFGESQVESEEVEGLIEQMDNICKDYIKSVRLQAAIEGRV